MPPTDWVIERVITSSAWPSALDDFAGTLMARWLGNCRDFAGDLPGRPRSTVPASWCCRWLRCTWVARFSELVDP